MKRIKEIIGIFIISQCFIISLEAQPAIDLVLRQIEQNNTGLAALRQQIEAEKAGNKTGIYPGSPEVEFHYLPGNRSEMGNRVDFSVQQSFDFPTAYYHKRKVSDGKNIQAETKYRIERKDILLHAKQICIELVYCNALNKEYQKRLEHAGQIATAYQTQFEKGEVSILDRNKAQLNLLNAEKEAETGRINRDLLLGELTTLNGGNVVSFDDTEFSTALLSDFESWYAVNKEKNLMLQYLQQEIGISKQNEKLQRSLNLPKFSAGYMSEKVLDEHFQGLLVGVSIPLWENKNTIKQIKLQTQAYQQAQTDAELQQYNRLKAQYEKASKLQRISNTYRTTFANINNSDLLKKALDAGEISLINYIVELGIYYDAINQLLESERDLQLLVAELQQWEL